VRENMIKALAVLLLIGLSFADSFTFTGQGAIANSSTTTTESWQMGYGTQQVAGGESMLGEILILAGVALIYIAFGVRNNGTN
jgi:hypothetical protein